MHLPAEGGKDTETGAGLHDSPVRSLTTAHASAEMICPPRKPPRVATWAVEAGGPLAEVWHSVAKPGRANACNHGGPRAAVSASAAGLSRKRQLRVMGKGRTTDVLLPLSGGLAEG